MARYIITQNQMHSVIYKYLDNMFDINSFKKEINPYNKNAYRIELSDNNGDNTITYFWFGPGEYDDETKHYGIGKNLTTPSQQFALENVGNTSKPIKPMFLTKDIMPVLASLANTDIVGSVKLAVNEDLLVLAYKTALATYTVSVPSCTVNAKRNGAAFAAYGE
jgi:hypothetical protein